MKPDTSTSALNELLFEQAPQGQTLMHLFEAQVCKNPDQTALMLNQEEITYLQLNQRINEIAFNLQDHGVTRGHVVGLMLDRSVDLIAGMLAILKLGAAYLPLDQEYPVKRLSGMLADSTASCVLTNSEYAKQVPKGLTCIDVDQQVESHEVTSVSEANDLAYIIYTSGSTGRPKGVMVEHHSVVNLTQAQIDNYGVSSSDRILQFSSFTFDASVEQIWLALASGATCVLIGKEHFAPGAFQMYLDAHQVTHVDVTPTFLESVGVEFPPCVRRIIVGGEACNPQTISRLSETVDVYNAYGPTEATVTSLIYQVPRNFQGGQIPIGRPIGHSRVYLLNENGNQVSIGEIGEIYLVGSCVAKGYCNDEALTQKRFLPDPWHPGHRMYKTGDLGRFLADGYIEFAGRVDEQVKIRGFRIELGEIKSLIAAVDGVQDAAVQVVGEGMHKSILAYYVGKDAELEVAIREHLETKLPLFMMPEHFVAMDQLPMNASGKVDTKALLVPQLQSRQDSVLPADEKETNLLNIWSELLRLAPEAISTKDSFFQMGGHSLLAGLLVHRMHLQFGVTLSLKDIFAHPTIQQQGRLLTICPQESSHKLPKAEDAEHYPLTASQHRFYLLHLLDPQAVAYNVPLAFRLKGNLDKDKLLDALNQLVARHEVLRTNFSEVEGTPRQVIHPDKRVTLEKLQANESDLEATLSHFVQPFDLSQGPLFRVGLVSMAADYQVLILDMDHIITDGVSQSLLMSELVQLYNGTALDPLELDFKDYASWEDLQNGQQLNDTHRKYWLKEYEYLEPLNLALDHERPAVKDFKGDRLAFELGASDTRSLQAICDQQEVTMNTLLFSIFKVLLFKLSNQEELVVGTPVSGRNRPELAELMGVFVNTMVLKTHPSGDMSFQQYLHAVNEKLLAHYAHFDYPFDQLLEDLKVERDASHNPLFDVMFSYENFDMLNQPMEGLDMRTQPISSGAAKLDLNLIVSKEEEKLCFDLEYATSLFNRQTIESYASFLQLIISQLIDRTDVLLKDIDLLQVAEKELILKKFNQEPKAYHPSETVLSLLARQVTAQPEATALKYEDQMISYQEFDQLSNRVAANLQAQGVQHGDLVGILLPRNPWMVITIYGILKTGAAYIPMDPAYPAGRVENIAKDASLRWLVGDVGTALKLDETRLIDFSDLQVDRDFTPKSITLNQSDLAYVIYTSGSTGKPKGVMIEHGSLYNFARCMNDRYPLGKTDSYLLKTTYTFDVSCAELFGWMVTGGSLTVLPADGEKDPERILQTIEQQQVTHVSFVPSMFLIMLEVLEQKGVEQLKNLKFLFLAGEALPATLVRRFDQLNLSGKLENIYGPTEATIYSSAYSTGDLKSTKVPIGKPLDHANLYVVDDQLKLQPVGVVGELCIAGNGLARGYLNNETLTNEKFVPNPFVDGERMYLTGDLVRWLPDGNIEYLGRKDSQIKLRGYRIELGEIESLLLSHPNVSGVAVALKGSGSHAKLVAYYTSENPQLEQDLTGYLGSHLPQYMVPQIFVQLDEIPLSGSGKVNRKALPDLDLGAMASTITLPVNETETKLVKLWTEILMLNPAQISTDIGFFQLGGHSLLASILVNRIYREFGITLSLKDIFDHRNIRLMAKKIAGSTKVEQRVISRAKSASDYPMSASQGRFHLLHWMDPSAMAYNVPLAITLRGTVDVAQLTKAINQLVSRNEILRTNFKEIDGRTRQVIREEQPISLELFSVEASLLENQLEVFVQPFDIKEDLLIRAGLFSTDELDHVLLLDMHHIITDGVSQGILMKELVQLYNGEILEAPALEFKDYANWESAAEEKEALEVDRKYWLEECSDLLPLNVATDFERPAVKDFAGDVITFRLNTDQRESLIRICESSEVTMNTLLTTFFNVLVYKLSNQEEVVIGTPVSGRKHMQVSDMMGVFVNTMVLRTFPKGAMSFKAYLQLVNDKLLANFDHFHYPFDQLLEDLEVTRDASHNPLFDVMFSYENFDMLQEKMDGIETGLKKVLPGSSKLDFNLVVWDESKELCFGFEYATSLFKRATIESYVSFLLSIIEQIVTDQEVLLEDIELVQPAEKARLLTGFNPELKSPLKDTVLSLLERQVALQPNVPALKFQDQVYSYESFHSLSDGVAGYLQAQGVSSGDLVGVLLPRDPWMVICLFGILKSGAAYVPMDPQYPPGRVKRIVEDAELKWVICEEGASIKIEEGAEISLTSIKQHKDAAYEKPTIQPTDLAYVIYTSGSTGKPKGVMIEHQSLHQVVGEMDQRYPLQASASYLLKTTYTFDVSCAELFGWFVSGGSLTILPDGGEKDPGLILETIRDHQVTHVSFVPSMFSVLLDYLDQEGSRQLESLKYLFLAGEALPAGLVHRYDQLKLSAKLENIYGPTEGTIYSSYYATEGLCGNKVPIGKPLDHVQLYVVNDKRKLQPIGVVGELCIAGHGLARGYLNNETLTNEKFVPNPFVDGARMYLTGDLVRWLPDGNIEYLGRKDDQVKLRGYRIELGEIESQLLNHPDVSGGAVVVKGSGSHARLVAYYASNISAIEEELKAVLSSQLPAYMVPEIFVRLDQIPLNASGKVDRKSLPEPESQLLEEYLIPPANEVEEQILSFWAELLEMDPAKISVTHNFFQIGGNSLKVMLLVNLIVKTFHVQLSFQDFFDKSTIRSMAKFIDFNQWISRETQPEASNKTELII